MVALGDAGLQHQGSEGGGRSPGPWQDANAGPCTFWACCSAAIFLAVWATAVLIRHFEFSGTVHHFQRGAGRTLIAEDPKRGEGKRTSGPDTLASILRRREEPGFWASLGGNSDASHGEETSAHSVPKS